MNKKGAFTDWFYIIAVLFMTFVCLIIAMIVVSRVNTTGLFADTPIAQDAIDTTEKTLLGFDNLLLFVIVGLSLFVLVSSAMVWNHPAFFITGFFLLVIAVVVAAIASNAFWDFVNMPTIAPTAAQFPKMLFLMNKLPWYIAFMGMASSIAMYISYQRQFV